jgi:hypothetical protein
MSARCTQWHPLSAWWVQVREVVEVKNHCPFKTTAAPGVGRRRGKVAGHRYSVVAGHPAAKVQPQWVPQMQLHMLASGCTSGLLVSRWGRLPCSQPLGCHSICQHRCYTGTWHHNMALLPPTQTAEHS